MAKVNILLDALRKHRVGLIKKEDLVRVFLRIEEKLTTYIDNFETFRYDLRAFEANRLEEYQELIFAIHTNNKRGQFKSVIDLVSRAKEVRSEIDESLKVIFFYKQAKGMLARLLAEIDADVLHRMPTISILKSTLAEAEKLMKAGKYRQAQVIITFCSLETKGLKEKNRKLTDFPEILSAIEELKLICSNSSTFSTRNADPPLEIEGRIEFVLHSLLEEGQSALVRKLLDDLQILLRNRKTFQYIYSNTPKEKKDLLSEGLLDAIEKDGWAGGSNYILSHRINSFFLSLQSTSKRLDQAQNK